MMNRANPFEKALIYKQLFENGDAKCLPFGTAFEMMRTLNINGDAGKYGIRLPEWSEDMYITIQFPDEHSKMSEPYIYGHSDKGNVPWFIGNTTIFRNDWDLTKIYEVKKKHPLQNYVKNCEEKCSDKCLHKCLGECEKVKDKDNNMARLLELIRLTKEILEDK